MKYSQSIDTFFLDYEHLNRNLASIRLGKKTGDDGMSRLQT